MSGDSAALGTDSVRPKVLTMWNGPVWIWNQ